MCPKFSKYERVKNLKRDCHSVDKQQNLRISISSQPQLEAMIKSRREVKLPISMIKAIFPNRNEYC